MRCGPLNLLWLSFSDRESAQGAKPTGPKLVRTEAAIWFTEWRASRRRRRLYSDTSQFYYQCFPAAEGSWPVGFLN